MYRRIGSSIALLAALAVGACGTPSAPGGAVGDRGKADNDGPQCGYNTAGEFGSTRACAEVKVRKLNTPDGPATSAQIMAQNGEIHYGLDAAGKPLYRWEVKTLHGWRACLTSDADGDGVPEYSDNCPNNWGPAGPFGEDEIDYRALAGYREANGSDCSYTSPEWASIETPAPTSGARTFRLVLRARFCNRIGFCTPGFVASEGIDLGDVDGGGVCGYESDYERIAWNTADQSCIAIPKPDALVAPNADGVVALDASCCMEALAESCSSLKQTYLDMISAGDPDGTVCTGAAACESFPVVPGCNGFSKPVPASFLDQPVGAMNGATVRDRLTQWTEAWNSDGCNLTAVGACDVFVAQAAAPICANPRIICGTIMGLSNCPSGMSCKLDGSFPNAGGTCVAN